MCFTPLFEREPGSTVEWYEPEDAWGQSNMVVRLYRALSETVLSTSRLTFLAKSIVTFWIEATVMTEPNGTQSNSYGSTTTAARL